MLNAQGGTVGVAAHVGPREILTCAHVVNAALGQDLHKEQAPSDEVTVAFGDGPRLRARVERWLPPPRPGAVGDDIAGLVLTSAELPIGATPVQLAVDLRTQGRLVQVFGYPHNPRRPHGAWATATVRGRTDSRNLQLDCTPDSAVRIQPGFSGSPVYDCATSLMVGLLTTASDAATEYRDSCAIPADRLRLAWPEVLDPGHTQPQRRVSELTILHVSDLQFGRDPLAGGNGLTPADQAHNAQFRRLHDDLAALSEDHGLRPDLMVVTGDLTKRGLGSEFDQAVEFLTALTEAVKLPRRRVAIVPGNHDVNRKACEAHFIDHEADEREPVAPYWPKWKHFADAFNQFYQGINEVSFTQDEPWTLFEMPDLAVVVAGLNSTIAESHRDADHYGWVGEQQLGWFADRLARYRDQGWLRLAAVHHNAVRGAVAGENLRDADDLGRRLGQPGLVNLLLQGHTHDGRLHRLPSGLLALPTGSATVTAETRPPEVPNQYQVLTVHPNAVTRHARRYSLGEHRWISATGSDWRQHHELVPPLRHVHGTFASDAPDHPSSPLTAELEPTDGFFSDVLAATNARHPDARVALRPKYGYLRVSEPLPDGGGAAQWPVGVVDGEVTVTALESFVARVHADPSVPSVLVYRGPPAAKDMVRRARHHGVHLRSFVDYQGLVDLRPLVQSQTDQLAADPIYPTQLYVPQRYQFLDNGPDSRVCDDLLGQVIDWLSTDDARFVMVLGDFGRGKTFLLRELARTLQQHLPDLPPVLLELRNLEKKNTLEELLAQHLLKQGVNTVDRTKLRYMINSGRLVLLCDGYDELELRIGYDNAADYLKILLGAVTENAKVVLTSRNQHFRSNAQISTTMGAQVNIISSQVVELKDFTDDQIMQFLTRHYGGDSDAAQARFALLTDVLDLRGLSRNPRMLSFIADLDERRLRAVQAAHGQISAAELYRELVEFWLLQEVDRDKHRGGLPTLNDKERLAACTTLALRLWATADRPIPLTEFTAKVSQTLTELAERKFTSEQAAHTVGVGTLLVRTPEGEFTFVHQSVMEWLVANSAAESLKNEERADTLLARRMSALMIGFLCDLAGHKATRNWAEAALADSAASTAVRANASAVTQRLGPAPYMVLVDVDLRGQDVTDWDFQNANIQGANLRDMWLKDANFAGADLRGAQLTGVRMIGGDLTGARLSDSLWHRAALLGVSGLDSGTEAPELAVAAIAGRDPADVMIAPTGDVSSVAFSPDGSLLALSRGSCVEIVDVASRHPLRVLSGHTGEVTGVAFSPDGTVVATTSTDRTTRLWNPTTGQHRTTLTGHTDQVTNVAFSPDGTVVATTSTDRTTRLWNPTTGQHRTTLTGHTDQVT
ncbi:MAG: metallophosphoesterase, partial [Pseudonocardiaceae bacterium]